eukprot:1161076-Pelagomonas_calceolata.AAC.2
MVAFNQPSHVNMTLSDIADTVTVILLTPLEIGLTGGLAGIGSHFKSGPIQKLRSQFRDLPQTSTLTAAWPRSSPTLSEIASMSWDPETVKQLTAAYFPADGIKRTASACAWRGSWSLCFFITPFRTNRFLFLAMVLPGKVCFLHACQGLLELMTSPQPLATTQQ